MTRLPPTSDSPPLSGAGFLFGIPLGDLGWFASLLMAVAAGFMAFFAATFCGIAFILIDHTAAHGTIDFTASYRWVGFPIGVVVMAIALCYMATLWIRRGTRRL